VELGRGEAGREDGARRREDVNRSRRMTVHGARKEKGEGRVGGVTNKMQPGGGVSGNVE